MKYIITFCFQLAIMSELTYAHSVIPKTLIFAVQPHDALLIKNKKHANNIVMKLARKLNVNIEIYECPWVRCVKAIESGDADIIDDLFFADDRATYTHFLEPSFETQLSGYRFYADNSKTKVIEKWDDLKDLRIGYLRGYKHFPKFDESEELTKIDLIDLEVIIQLILKDRLDIFISPPSFNESSIAKTDHQHRISKQPFSHVEPTPLFIGLSKKSAWFPHRKRLENTLNEIVKLELKSTTN